ncbi:MAG TPA: hypothetical protein VKS20_10875 [Candidatus Acidoferrales bacterium]|nr:hypothetical protein [Candidatus Acidoferrales bacterium]
MPAYIRAANRWVLLGSRFSFVGALLAAPVARSANTPLVAQNRVFRESAASRFFGAPAFGIGARLRI